MRTTIPLLALVLGACTGELGAPRDPHRGPEARGSSVAADASTPTTPDAALPGSETDAGAPPMEGDAGTSPADAGSLEPDAAPPPIDGGSMVPSPLSECEGGSIDRFQSWVASGEGTTVPRTGSILVPEAGDYVARIELVGHEWHVVPVLTANQFEDAVDLSSSIGFWLTYSATTDLYVQIRPGFAWSGGDKYLTRIPSTSGRVETRFFSFARDGWTTLPSLGTPSYSFESAIAAVRGFVFVGETPGVLEFRGLRVDGYEPPCR